MGVWVCLRPGSAGTYSRASRQPADRPRSRRSLPSLPTNEQEVYGRLEEPDGLQGLVRLRQGGPRPEDQRLAAEKQGNWSEALTLYEQALQHSGAAGASSPAGLQAAAALAAEGAAQAGGGAGGASGAGLGALQRGYLDSLLHIGHLQGLLTQVRWRGWCWGGGWAGVEGASLCVWLTRHTRAV